MDTDGSRRAGALLRHWRLERRLSQQALSDRSTVSTRHLSRVETGLAEPGRDLLLGLAAHLDLSLRDRNRLLLAGGHAPEFADTSTDDPSLQAVMAGFRVLLDAHDPFPALLLDDHWDVIDANDAATALLAGCAPALLEPPVNVVRISLHADGLAPRIVNLDAWAAHLVGEVRHRWERTGDPVLAALLADAEALVGAHPRSGAVPDADGSPVLALGLRTGAGTLRLFTTTARLTAPNDAAIEGLHLETFLPADEATRAALTADTSAGLPRTRPVP